jgi:hypothetical protein
MFACVQEQSVRNSKVEPTILRNVTARFVAGGLVNVGVYYIESNDTSKTKASRSIASDSQRLPDELFQLTQLWSSPDCVST